MPPSVMIRSLQKIWPAIDAARIPVAIAGRIAMSFWGHPRSTQDIHLLFVCEAPSNLIDQADVVSLVESHGNEFDHVYLSQWIEALGFQDSWKEIQRRIG